MKRLHGCSAHFWNKTRSACCAGRFRTCGARCASAQLARWKRELGPAHNGSSRAPTLFETALKNFLEQYRPQSATAGGSPASHSVPGQALAAVAEIGRASCRERVCQYVSISAVAVSLKKKARSHIPTSTSQKT